jgi:catechol O-methyltransferase
MGSIGEIGGRRLPFLRWSAIRMLLSARHGQVGDGREEALAAFVEEHARPGDLDDVIRAIDEFSYKQSFLMNVGDEKGEILDAAVRRAAPRRVLELGTYCGYSALRIARVMPDDGHLYSVELLAANTDIARRMWAHGGVADRITGIIGTLGDGGATITALEDEHGFGPNGVDLVFIDHDKAQYLPDLLLIDERGWLRPGALVVADNVRIPGSPAYRAYMREHEGDGWRTIEHETHVEYQTLLKDLVLESEYQRG